MSIARVDWLVVYDLKSTCQLETCPAKAGKQMKEQAAYNVVGCKMYFYRAVTGQRARLWSLDSARCHVWSWQGLVKVKQHWLYLPALPPLLQVLLKPMNALLNGPSERELRNRRDNCSAVWVIVSAWPIQRSTLIHLRIAVCAVTWLTAQSSNRRLKRNSVIVRSLQPPGNSSLVLLVVLFIFFT